MKTLVTIALCFALAGCAAPESATTGGTEATPAADTAGALPAEASGPSPCDSITEAEATEALGQPSRYRSPAGDGSSNCIIEPAEGETGITVDFRITDDRSAFQLEAANAETISGLGDVAVWNGSAIAVKKGERYLIANVSRVGAPAGDLKTPAVAFARKIVERM